MGSFSRAAEPFSAKPNCETIEWPIPWCKCLWLKWLLFNKPLQSAQSRSTWSSPLSEFSPVMCVDAISPSTMSSKFYLWIFSFFGRDCSTNKQGVLLVVNDLVGAGTHTDFRGQLKSYIRPHWWQCEWHRLVWSFSCVCRQMNKPHSLSGLASMHLQIYPVSSF